MFAPEGVTASTVNARNISLRWSWRLQQYNHLNLTCQVNVSHGGTSTIRENVGVGLNAAAFNDLIPNWTYNVTVRCGTAEHFWRWGDWSESVTVHTQGDVPDALDVWMQMKENLVVILWKMPLANQSHGNIIDYDVTWVNTVNASEHSVALSLDTSEEHVVTVKARNINGSSSPSTITIPSLGPDQTTVNTSWITGSDGGFNLSWLASPSATCGYVVDWCPTSGSGPVEWLKVPPNDTNAFIFSENFNDGVRYSLSIYACTQKAPVLVERREGYVRETRIEEKLFKPLTFKQQGADAEVSWHAIPLREQSAFIQGYTLYYWNNRGKVFSVSTDDPEATSLTATDLNITSYTFTVTAKTAVGECGNASITATLNSLSDTSIQSVLVSLGVVFGLLSLTTVLCYRHWACIKHKVYPPIPKPELMWVTSQGQFRCRQLDEVQSYPSEASIMDISELHYKYRTPVTNNYSREEVPFVFSQTPKGLFLNPSYDLTMQTGDQQASSGPEVHEGTTGIRYQPPTETILLNQPAEDQDTPLVCVSSYILLPQTPST
ncbi:oncostatin-M-specific receptor subunit beta-like [Brachyistius frenatus]|uniref:oncostatin-M-specific receptor subunit beta-like n=1 Tax=Brachyistius frenatus TaxID=100188 RepID=UPI0037E961EB